MYQIIKPMTGIFTYALGISVVSLFPQLPSIGLVAIIGIFSLSLTAIGLFRSAAYFPVGTLLLGFTVGLGYGKWLQHSALPLELEQQVLTVRGVVVGLPVTYEQSTRFLFKVDAGEYKGVIQKVRLSWFSPPPLASDERWQLTVKLRRPHGFASPGTFDFEAWAAREGIQAMGYVREGHRLGSLPEKRSPSLRASLSQWLSNYAPQSSLGIVKALLVGDKSAISTTQWAVFNKTGTTHLLVISGLHIGLMALFGYWLTALAARLGLAPISWIPLPRLAGCVSLLFALLYAGLAGWNVPVQRALVMTTVALTGPLLGIRPSPWSLLVIALAAVLTFDPLAVTGTGFWYSFMAVMALIYGLSGRVGKAGIGGNVVYKYFRPQWVVFCVLTPLLFFNGQSVSLLSPFINLLAIPFIGLIIVPLLLVTAGVCAVIPCLSTPLLTCLDTLLMAFVQGLEWLAAIDYVSPGWGQPGVVAVLLAVAGGLLLVSPFPLRLKLLAPLFFLPWFYPDHDVPNPGKADVVVMDVGQGLAVLVRTHTHCLVYDTGDAFSDNFIAADRVVIPCLRRMGVQHLDKVIISHGDKDHAGGLTTLLRSYHCSSIACGTKIPGFSRGVSQCRAGQSWQWDGVSFQVLSGGGGWSKGNDRSCVLKVLTPNGDSILLTGDISSRVEKRLVSSGQPLKSRILLAPHHGSRYSSERAFLEAVKPQIVLFSSGYRNQFGHPAAETVARVKSYGAESWNTANHGTLFISLGNQQAKVEAYRLSHRRYWWN